MLIKDDQVFCAPYFEAESENSGDMSCKRGRPKGTYNVDLKLDKHKNEIIKYRKLGVSKASIAKIIGCHPASVDYWLERRYPELNNRRKVS